MSDYSDLIEDLHAIALHLEQGADSNTIAAALNQKRAETVSKAADALTSQAAAIRNQASALAERDARIDFLQDVLERAEQELKKAQK